MIHVGFEKSSSAGVQAIDDGIRAANRRIVAAVFGFMPRFLLWVRQQ